MGDVLSLTGFAHAVAFHGLCEDQRGLSGMLRRRRIGCVHFHRIRPAAPQRPDLLVGPVCNHRRRLGVLAKEMLTHISPVLRLKVLVLAVDAFLHALAKFARDILRQQRIPTRTPQYLDDVPASAAEDGFQLLHDLAVAAHGAVEPLQIAVDNEHQVIEFLAAAERDRAERFRLVHLTIAHERPHLTWAGVRKPTPVQIFQEARLVDRHQWPETHRDRGELPELRHQPRVRIR